MQEVSSHLALLLLYVQESRYIYKAKPGRRSVFLAMRYSCKGKERQERQEQLLQSEVHMYQR